MGERKERRGAGEMPMHLRLAELLTRTSWRLRRAERKELKAFGLSFGQARALRILARRGGAMRIKDLAERLEIVPRSATTVVDVLERAGLVERRDDPSDRRAVLAVMSTGGWSLLGRMAEERGMAADVLFGRLSSEQQEALLELLEILRRDADAEARG